jgi:hypothetical protein
MTAASVATVAAGGHLHDGLVSVRDGLAAVKNNLGARAHDERAPLDRARPPRRGSRACGRLDPSAPCRLRATGFAGLAFAAGAVALAFALLLVPVVDVPLALTFACVFAGVAGCDGAAPAPAGRPARASPRSTAIFVRMNLISLRLGVLLDKAPLVIDGVCQRPIRSWFSPCKCQAAAKGQRLQRENRAVTRR